MNINIIQCKESFSTTPGLILANNLTQGLNFKAFDKLSNATTNSRWIPNSSIVKGSVYMQFLGMTNYQDIEIMNEDPLFENLIGNISPETYRQRFDFLGKESDIEQIIDDMNTDFLQKVKIDPIIYNGQEYYALDIDVTPFTDESHKESIAMTYKKHLGYAPIMAYLGSYAIKFELRPGSQHSANGAIKFVEKCFRIIQKIGIPLDQVLVRCDSGHDDSIFMNYCEERGVKFLIKRNLHGQDRKLIHEVLGSTEPVYRDDRPNYRVYNYIDFDKKPCKYIYRNCITIYRVNQKYSKDYFQESLIGPIFRKNEIEAYWTNLNVTNKDGTVDMNGRIEDIIELYHQHAESEQYHSELKTDMDMELLPSKHFATNALFLQLSVIAFNMLRAIGKIALEVDDKLQPRKSRSVKRLRLGTVIKRICMGACRIVTHAREAITKFGSNYSLFDSFYGVYNATLG